MAVNDLPDGRVRVPGRACDEPRSPAGPLTRFADPILGGRDDQELAAQLEPANDLGVGMMRLALHTAIRDHESAWTVIRNTASALLDAYPEIADG